MFSLLRGNGESMLTGSLCDSNGGRTITTLEDAYTIALSFPGTQADVDRRSVSVLHKGKQKGIMWVWLERIHPKKARVPNPGVAAVKVRDLAEKELLLATNPEVLFTEPHYDGYPAVLARLDSIDPDLLELLITNAWRCQAPPSLVEEFDGASR